MGDRDYLKSNHPNDDDSNDDCIVRRFSRKFDYDDTIGDVVNWLGCAAGQFVPSKLQSGEWNLVNANKRGKPEHYDRFKIDVVGFGFGSNNTSTNNTTTIQR